MNEYKPNSHKYKAEMAAAAAEEKKVEAVVKGGVKTRRKSGVRKFGEVFVAEDASKVKDHIFADVFVPAIKKLIADIVKDGIEILLYGETKPRSSSGSKGTYVSYRDFSDRREPPRTSAVTTGFDFDDLVFESRGAASAVIDQMEALVDRFGEVSVADMFESAGLSAPYTANKYGWTSVRTAEPVHTRDGYVIKLPKPGILERK